MCTTANKQEVNSSGESTTEAAASLRASLQKSPSQVNQLVDGMAQLHHAARDGNIPALKVLLEFNPNLNIEDSENRTPLSHCIERNQPEAAQLLIDAGADVNCVAQGIALLTYAAVIGCHRILCLLAQNPSIQLNAFMVRYLLWYIYVNCIEFQVIHTPSSGTVNTFSTLSAST